MNSQNLVSPNRDSFGTPTWESRDKKPFGCGCRGVTQRILYGGRWWPPSSLGRGESCESRITRGLSQHQGCSRMRINQLVGWFDVGLNEKLKLVPLPSPIPELQYAPLPLLVLRAGSVLSNPHNFAVLETKAHLGPNLGLGSASLCVTYHYSCLFCGIRHLMSGLLIVMFVYNQCIDER